MNETLREIYEMPVDQLLCELDTTSNYLHNLKSRLDAIQRTCQHKWGEVRYTPDVQEAYTIPGDAPGTMGIDWRGSTWVPRSEKKVWTRTCGICKLEQRTEHTKPEYVAGKIAGTGGQVEVPYFGVACGPPYFGGNR